VFELVTGIILLAVLGLSAWGVRTLYRDEQLRDIQQLEIEELQEWADVLEDRVKRLERIRTPREEGATNDGMEDSSDMPKLPKGIGDANVSRP